jgi:MFS family permease
MIAPPIVAAFALAIALTTAPAARADVFPPAPDKRLHAFYGSAAGVVGYSVATAGGAPRWLRWVGGFGAGVLLGAAKEGWDARGHGRVELADALWTAAPAALLAGVLWLADRRSISAPAPR